MVSIIIPVYNVENYLHACVESVCGQTLRDLEIILVDDGSTDRSGEICDEFAEKDSRVVVIHKENGGLVSARKAGLEKASGEFAGYVDGDDWVEASMYEDLLGICQREDADIAISPFYSGGSRSCIPEGIYSVEDGSMDLLIKNMIYVDGYSEEGIHGSLCNKLFKKDLLCRHQFKVDPQIIVGEDGACTYPCVLDANKIAVTNQAYYHYRARSDSVCNSFDDRYFERITRLFQGLKTAFTGHRYEKTLMEQLNHHMLNFVLQGINKRFGFGFGVVVPFYLPPYDLLRNKALSRIVLYGAGDVGQGYYRAFQLTKAVEVAAWVDRQWETCRRKGLPVESAAVLETINYEGILIAVDDPEIAKEIENDLGKQGISKERIFYERPRKFIQTV